MGLTTAFVVHRDGEGRWFAHEDTTLEARVTEGAEAALVARVLDSDVCQVIATGAAGEAWTWVFGDAQTYGVPVSGLTVEETATTVAAWSGELGLSAERAALVAALERDGVFAEEGWFALLTALGIDAEVDAAEPPAPPAERPMMTPMEYAVASSPRAIALDHTSAGWRHLEATRLHGRWGEPPCVVQVGPVLLLGLDDPFVLGSYVEPTDEALASRVGGTGGWVSVPAGELTGDAWSDIGRAVRWARVNVGEQGRPPRADRPSTWRELVPDHLPDVRGLVVDDLPRSIVDHQWSYALAPERRLTCRLELATPLDGDAVASALDLLRRRLVDGIFGQVVDAGGRVTFGEGTCTTAYAGQVHGLARTTAGRFSANDGDRPAWERTLKRIRADELVEAQVVFAVADGTGVCDSGVRLGAVTVSWSSPDARGHHRPVISVEVGEVFRGIAPADVVEVLREASAGLPVSAGHVDVGRFSADRSVGRWGTLRPLRPALDTTVFAEVEPWPSTATSDLVLARATPEPEELTLLARDAVSAAWGEQPLDIADVVRRGP